MREYSRFKQVARRRGLSVQLTPEQFHWFRNGRCAYCDVSAALLARYADLQGIRTPFMTIDRMNNQLPYLAENCCSACFVCNRMKGNLLTHIEMREIGQKYLKPRWERWSESVMDALANELPIEPEPC